MIQHAAEQNTILAMPGTIQGRSGWYEFDESDTRFVVEYEVIEETGAWELKKGPLRKELWLAEQAKEKKLEGG